MYFKTLNKLKEELLMRDSSGETNSFLFSLFFTQIIILLVGVGSISAFPFVLIWAIIDHIITGTINLYKYIRYGNVKKKRIKEVKSIIQEHGNKLLLADRGYILKHNVDNKPYHHDKLLTLRSFIFDFLWDLNSIYNTYDHLNQHMICNTRRRRSLGDIFLICKHYYPDCTIEDVLTILIKLLNEKDIFASWCTTINKYVFHTDSRNWNRNDKTEYHKDLKFNELIEIYK